MDHQGERTHRKQGLVSVARDIIDSNAYLTLATADENGRPWASPVWYASEAYAYFYWVSSPEARHSRNLAVRPEVGIVELLAGQHRRKKVDRDIAVVMVECGG